MEYARRHGLKPGKARFKIPRMTLSMPLGAYPAGSLGYKMAILAIGQVIFGVYRQIHMPQSARAKNPQRRLENFARGDQLTAWTIVVELPLSNRTGRGLITADELTG